MNQEEKEEIINRATEAYGQFMTALGFDWQFDPHTQDTPKRVAKAFVNDLFAGVYDPPPVITDFENSDNYSGMVFQGNIEVKSICAHHHLSFIGKAHVAYIPGKSNRVIGLSKLNRIVEYFARRPQVQENLTQQIANYLNGVCNTNTGIAVMIEASHLCASCRGVKHDSTMMTSVLLGGFMTDDSIRQEFYNYIKLLKMK